MATSRFLHPTRTPAAPLEENTSPCLPSKLAQAFAVVLALLYYLFFFNFIVSLRGKSWCYFFTGIAVGCLVSAVLWLSPSNKSISGREN